MPDTKHLVLVGLPGAGKSSVGRELAGRLNRGFIDLDLYIERSFGKSVVEIFASGGEAAFRDAEADVSRSVWEMPPSVIAPGGGWLFNPGTTAHLLDRSRIIYLRVSPDAAIRRMGRGIRRRPLLRSAADPYQAMRALFEARGPRYESAADLIVDTTDLGRSHVIATVVEQVLAAERDLAREL